MHAVSLSNPNGSWTGPLPDKAGKLKAKPTWEAGECPARIITDASGVVVDDPKEVKRFHGCAWKLSSSSTNCARNRAGAGRSLYGPERFQAPCAFWRGLILPEDVEVAVIGAHFEERFIRAIPLVEHFFHEIIALIELEPDGPFIGFPA